MGQRKYPPLTPHEVVAILSAHRFSKKHQVGTHAQYECPKSEDRPRSVVTVDMGHREFDDDLMKSMIRQSNLTREEFYGATRRTAHKAAVPLLKLSPSMDSD